MAKSNYIVRGGANFNELYKELDKAQKSMTGFKNGISKTMRAIGSVLGTLAVGKLVKDSTQAAMSVESAVDNINRNMQSSAKAYQDWVNTQSQAMGIAKKDAYSYGSTFSNLLGSFTSSAADTAEQTTELMNATAIIASKTGRTFEDTASRIRSGMLGSTEAIEDLGIYTQVSMIESTNAFREFAGDSSWQQLDFQTQQQIRLAAILEQTYARYGDTLADTTQTRHAMFIASLQNIQLALGQAFLPIYNAVLPALTAMANALGRVINYVAQFVTAIFGSGKKAVQPMVQQAQAIGGAASGMQDLGKATQGAGKAAKKAGKEAKGALAGFDEINTLSIPSSSDSGADGGSGGGAGGIGGGGIGGMEIPALDTGGFASSTVEVTERVQAMVNRVKGALNSLKDFFKENASTIKSVFAGVVSGVGTLIGLLIYKHWDVLMLRLSKSTGFFGIVIKSFKSLVAVLSTITAPMLAIAALVGLAVGALVNLWNTNDEFKSKVIGAWNGIVDTAKNLWNTILKPIIDAVKDELLRIWNDSIKPLWKHWENFVAEIVYLMVDLWNGMKPVLDWIIKNFGPGIVEVFKGLVRHIGAGISLIIDIVGSVLQAFTGIVRGIRQIFGGLIDFIAGIFTGDWRRAWSGVQQIFSGVGTVISSVWGGIKGIFSSIINYVKFTFSNAWSSAWNAIKTVFSNVFGSLKNIAKTPINWIISAINTLIRGLNRFNIKIPGWVGKLAGVSGGSFGFNISQIPHLAKGGITNGEMLAVVGDNPGGREVVSPLDTLQSMLVDSVSTALAQNGGGTGGQNVNADIAIQIGGETFARVAIKEINKLQDRMGQTLIRV